MAGGLDEEDPTLNEESQLDGGVFSQSLTRKLIQFHEQEEGNNETLRVSSDAAAVAGELLRLFVIEVRERASILAECDQEKEGGESTKRDNKKKYSIRPEHVTQVAAEILMDFS